jgi:hypothetical protein
MIARSITRTTASGASGAAAHQQRQLSAGCRRDHHAVVAARRMFGQQDRDLLARLGQDVGLAAGDVRRLVEGWWVASRLAAEARTGGCRDDCMLHDDPRLPAVLMAVPPR